MRGWLVAVLVCCLAMAACHRRPPEARLLTQSFPTEGMTCSGCEHAIQAAVSKLEGVKQVRASHILRATEVTYDIARLKPEQIIAAIDKLGYRASSPK
jgi:copper chaperone CopZ